MKFRFINNKKYYEMLDSHYELTVSDIKYLMNCVHEFGELLHEEDEALWSEDVHDIRHFYSKVGDLNLLEAEAEVLVDKYKALVARLRNGVINNLTNDDHTESIPVVVRLFEYLEDVDMWGYPYVEVPLGNDVINFVNRKDGPVLTIHFNPSITFHVGGIAGKITTHRGHIYKDELGGLGEEWSETLTRILGDIIVPRPVELTGDELRAEIDRPIQEMFDDMPKDWPSKRKGFIPPPCVGSPL